MTRVYAPGFRKKKSSLVITFFLRKISLKNSNWNKFKEHFSYPQYSSFVNNVTKKNSKTFLSVSKSTTPLKTCRESLAPRYISLQCIHLYTKILTAWRQKIAAIVSSLANPLNSSLEIGRKKFVERSKLWNPNEAQKTLKISQRKTISKENSIPAKMMFNGKTTQWTSKQL